MPVLVVMVSEAMAATASPCSGPHTFQQPCPAGCKSSLIADASERSPQGQMAVWFPKSLTTPSIGSLLPSLCLLLCEKISGVTKTPQGTGRDMHTRLCSLCRLVTWNACVGGCISWPLSHPALKTLKEGWHFPLTSMGTEGWWGQVTPHTG